MIANTTWLPGLALALFAYIVKTYTLMLPTIDDSKGFAPIYLEYNLIVLIVSFLCLVVGGIHCIKLR